MKHRILFKKYIKHLKYNPIIIKSEILEGEKDYGKRWRKTDLAQGRN